MPPLTRKHGIAVIADAMMKITFRKPAEVSQTNYVVWYLTSQRVKIHLGYSGTIGIKSE